MKSAKIKHDYFVYPILRMGTIFFAKRRSRANEHLKNAHLQQLLYTIFDLFNKFMQDLLCAVIL